MARRGPLPTECPGCSGRAPRLTWEPPDPAPPPPPADPAPPTPERSPFTAAAADRAPVADQPAVGRIEHKLRADLDALDAIGHPASSTLAELALVLAQSADAIDPGDIRGLIAATKQIRELLNQIAPPVSTPQGKDVQAPDDSPGDSPFGAVRAELVNPPAV